MMSRQVTTFWFFVLFLGFSFCILWVVFCFLNKINGLVIYA